MRLCFAKTRNFLLLFECTINLQHLPACQAKKTKINARIGFVDCDDETIFGEKKEVKKFRV